MTQLSDYYHPLAPRCPTTGSCALLLSRIAVACHVTAMPPVHYLYDTPRCLPTVAMAIACVSHTTQAPLCYTPHRQCRDFTGQSACGFDLLNCLLAAGEEQHGKHQGAQASLCHINAPSPLDNSHPISKIPLNYPPTISKILGDDTDHTEHHITKTQASRRPRHASFNTFKFNFNQ
jgi:hypothetical protein